LERLTNDSTSQRSIILLINRECLNNLLVTVDELRSNELVSLFQRD
jgi:hypothetical protein